MKFECTKCGKCCISPVEHPVDDGIYATADEVLNIEARIGKKLNIKKINDKTYRILLDKRCEFLRDNGECAIYDIAPLYCKTPPVAYLVFLPYYTNICDGIGIGKEYSEQDIAEMRQRLIDTYGEDIIR